MFRLTFAIEWVFNLFNFLDPPPPHPSLSNNFSSRKIFKGEYTKFRRNRSGTQGAMISIAWTLPPPFKALMKFLPSLLNKKPSLSFYIFLTLRYNTFNFWRIPSQFLPLWNNFKQFILKLIFQLNLTFFFFE